MHDTPALASAPYRAAWPWAHARPAPPWPTDTPRRPDGVLTILRSIVATWEERRRFRWDLAQMSTDNPHLIDDIGLTRPEVEAEIAKPFWQA